MSAMHMYVYMYDRHSMVLLYTCSTRGTGSASGATVCHTASGCSASCQSLARRVCALAAVPVAAAGQCNLQLETSCRCQHELPPQAGHRWCLTVVALAGMKITLSVKAPTLQVVRARVHACSKRAAGTKWRGTPGPLRVAPAHTHALVAWRRARSSAPVW